MENSLYSFLSPQCLVSLGTSSDNMYEYMKAGDPSDRGSELLPYPFHLSPSVPLLTVTFDHRSTKATVESTGGTTGGHTAHSLPSPIPLPSTVCYYGRTQHYYGRGTDGTALHTFSSLRTTRRTCRVLPGQIRQRPPPSPPLCKRRLNFK